MKVYTHNWHHSKSTAKLPTIGEIAATRIYHDPQSGVTSTFFKHKEVKNPGPTVSADGSYQATWIPPKDRTNNILSDIDQTVYPPLPHEGESSHSTEDLYEVDLMSSSNEEKSFKI